ncbi:MAG: cation:proton antiporter [Verrucomicrobia bacterium]|nr:cation:proton antiporter [Verrucomicrobiota bacterium]
MHGIQLIQDLAVILVVAGVFGWICQRLGLSVVVGFLTAGIVVGPFTPPFALVKDIGRVDTLAQLGLVFLMFSIGLKLSLRRLQRLGFSLLLAVSSGAAIIFYVTRLMGAIAGFDSRESLFLAAMLMVSSSSVITKVLQETGATHDRAGQLAMGVTVLEDVVAVVMLTLLNSVVQFGGMVRTPLSETLGLFGAFVVLAGIGGLLLVPWLLRKLSISAGEELQTLGLAGLLFALAVIAQRSGYSLALGAFLLGTIVAETPHRTQVERTFEGMRDVFTAVFFVAIGMQIDLRLLGGSIWLVLGVAAFTLVVRTIAMTVGLAIIGTSARDALRVGLVVTPIGEFSFVIAQLGVMAAVVPDTFYPMAVGVSLVTTLIAPFLTRHSEQISGWLLSRQPRTLRVWRAYYHTWLEHLQAEQKRNMLWQLSRKRFVQVGVEMLFVTGLLVFSESLLAAVVRWLGPDWLFPSGPTIMFWLVLSLVVLAPLVAIWRNLSTLCLLFAQVATAGHSDEKRLRPVVEVVFKFVAGMSLYIWLSTLIPTEGRARWIVIGSGAVAVVALLLFRRKLVYWHSELEVELQEVFRASEQMEPDLNSPWLRPHGEWNLSVVDCVLPDLANVQGRCIADLDLRARYGCTVVGVGRQGYMISLPAPDTVLYPRDKLLLLGTAVQVEAAKRFLLAVSGLPSTAAEFEDVRMETMVAPAWSRVVGQDLKTLSPTQAFRVQIAGIRRGKTRILSPAGEEIIGSGDELLVLGMPDRISEFRDWLLERTSTMGQEIK